MFRGFVLPEHRLTLRKKIKQNKELGEIFNDAWLRDNLLIPPDLPLLDAHPLYYYFANPNEFDLFFDGVKLLAKEKRLNVIKILKNSHDRDLTRSIIRNIQTYSIIKSNVRETEWEPRSNATRKVPDIVSKINKDKVYIEIFSVGGSKEENEEGLAFNELHARVNRMSDNPFIIGAELKGYLNIREIDRVMKFLKRTIRLIKSEKMPITKVYNNQKGQPLIEFEFNLSYKHGKGYWGYYSGGVRFRDDIGRIKKKIMDKLEKIQFHKKSDINGFCIYLEDFMLENEDVIDAILGQKVVIFSQANPETPWTRAKNGVVHHKIYGNIISDWIDFIVVAKHPNTFNDFSKVQKILNEEKNKITEPDLKKLFELRP